MYSYNDINKALKYLKGLSAQKYFEKYGMLNLSDPENLMKSDQYDLA